MKLLCCVNFTAGSLVAIALDKVAKFSLESGDLVPRPFEEEEEKGPGTNCLHMLHYLRGSDTILV